MIDRSVLVRGTEACLNWSVAEHNFTSIVVLNSLTIYVLKKVILGKYHIEVFASFHDLSHVVYLHSILACLTFPISK